MKQISDSTLVPLVQCEFVVHYVGKTTPRCRVLPLVHPSRTLVPPGVFRFVAHWVQKITPRYRLYMNRMLF